MKFLIIFIFFFSYWVQAQEVPFSDEVGNTFGHEFIPNAKLPGSGYAHLTDRRLGKDPKKAMDISGGKSYATQLDQGRANDVNYAINDIFGSMSTLPNNTVYNPHATTDLWEKTSAAWNDFFTNVGNQVFNREGEDLFAKAKQDDVLVNLVGVILGKNSQRAKDMIAWKKKLKPTEIEDFILPYEDFPYPKYKQNYDAYYKEILPREYPANMAKVVMGSSFNLDVPKYCGLLDNCLRRAGIINKSVLECIKYTNFKQTTFPTQIELAKETENYCRLRYRAAENYMQDYDDLIQQKRYAAYSGDCYSYAKMVTDPAIQNLSNSIYKPVENDQGVGTIFACEEAAVSSTILPDFMAYFNNCLPEEEKITGQKFPIEPNTNMQYQVPTYSRMRFDVLSGSNLNRFDKSQAYLFTIDNETLKNQTKQELVSRIDAAKSDAKKLRAVKTMAMNNYIEAKKCVGDINGFSFCEYEDFLAKQIEKEISFDFNGNIVETWWRGTEKMTRTVGLYSPLSGESFFWDKDEQGNIKADQNKQPMKKLVKPEEATLLATMKVYADRCPKSIEASLVKKNLFPTRNQQVGDLVNAEDKIFMEAQQRMKENYAMVCERMRNRNATIASACDKIDTAVKNLKQLTTRLPKGKFELPGYDEPVAGAMIWGLPKNVVQKLASLNSDYQVVLDNLQDSHSLITNVNNLETNLEDLMLAVNPKNMSEEDQEFFNNFEFRLVTIEAEYTDIPHYKDGDKSPLSKHERGMGIHQGVKLYNKEENEMVSCHWKQQWGPLREELEYFPAENVFRPKVTYVSVNSNGEKKQWPKSVEDKTMVEVKVPYVTYGSPIPAQLVAADFKQCRKSLDFININPESGEAFERGLDLAMMEKISKCPRLVDIFGDMGEALLFYAAGENVDKTIQELAQKYGKVGLDEKGIKDLLDKSVGAIKESVYQR